MLHNRYQFTKRKLALVIPAHNEEVVIADTIRSAIAAGQHPADIFVVSDGSVDQTVAIARAYLSAANVLDQPQGGKANAILNGIAQFRIIERYQWMHVADADGVFDPTYFIELLSRLDPKFVAATGYVMSLKGGLISQYRTYEYTIGLEIFRRIQSFFNVITVIPGPTSIFRTDILNQLDFTVNSLTEDMDLTIQIHRGKLGRIQYIPQARTLTQDPKDIRDFTKQVLRWYRGSFQVMQRHKIGRRAKGIDLYLGGMMLDQAVFGLSLIMYPAYAIGAHQFGLLGFSFLFDVTLFGAFAAFAAWRQDRPDVFAAFPLFYILRFLTLGIFYWSWFEIVVLRKFRTADAGWSTAGRRYRITTDAAA
jgi:cellulose synthase/poly-beta-1,6-N-acetylglucosamine synthase-like glycosyltransferase